MGRGDTTFVDVTVVTYWSHFKKYLFAIKDPHRDEAERRERNRVGERGPMRIGNLGEDVKEDPGVQVEMRSGAGRDHHVFKDARREFAEHVGGDCVRTKDEPGPGPALAPVHLLDGEKHEGEQSERIAAGYQHE